MKRFIFMLLFVTLSSPAFANRFFLGVEVNAIGISEESYIGKNTKEIIKNLNGKLERYDSSLLVIGICEGYQINEHISLIAKQRYFSTKLSADFYSQPLMNFELAKNVVPLNIGVKLNLRLDEIFGFYFELLPGIYIVDTFEKGYFGTSHKRETEMGANFGFGGDFVIKERVSISIGFLYEMFNIEQKNIILEDGGEGGGVGISLKLGILF